MKEIMKKRWLWTVVSLVIIIPIGFYSKLYRGPASFWINNSLGGVFYEIFWCLLIFLLFKRMRPWGIALAVLSVTCALEFLQLWHPPALVYLRSSFLGKAVLGTTFTWSDIPYYFAGCGIAYIWIILIQKYSE